MLHEDDSVRLRHMLDAAEEAREHAAGRIRDDLDSDRQLVHSLVRCIEIIGEAASRVSPECRAMMPDTRWSGIRGMRNRLIHAYFDVNLTVLWRSVIVELPELIAQLKTVLDA